MAFHAAKLFVGEVARPLTLEYHRSERFKK